MRTVIYVYILIGVLVSSRLKLFGSGGAGSVEGTIAMSEEEKIDTAEQTDSDKAEDTADVREPSAGESSETETKTKTDTDIDTDNEPETDVKESPAEENTDSDAPQGDVSSDDQPSDDSSVGDSPADGASSSDEVVPPLPDFSGMLADAAANSIDLLNDVELNVKIELGRAEMTVEEILRMSEGAVVELDKLAGDPVDVLVNEQLVARGEVLVVNDNFCVRINEIVPGISEQVGKPAAN